MWETWVRLLGWEDPLEGGMATHSSILAWRIAMDRRRAWQATVHGVAESDMTEKLSTHNNLYQFSSVTRSCLTLCDPMDLAPRLLCPWNSPGKNTGVCCHALLQGIFLIQGSNRHLPHSRQILCLLSHQRWLSLCSKNLDSAWETRVSLPRGWEECPTEGR